MIVAKDQNHKISQIEDQRKGDCSDGDAHRVPPRWMEYDVVNRGDDEGAVKHHGARSDIATAPFVDGQHRIIRMSDRQ